MVSYTHSKSWREVFNNPSDRAELKKAYNALAKTYHPEQGYPDDGTFVNIALLYRQAVDYFQPNKSEEELKGVIYTVKGVKHVLRYYWEETAGSDSVFVGKDKLLIIFKADDRELYENYIKSVASVINKKESKWFIKEFIKFIPNILDHGMTDDGNYYIELSKTSEIIPLSKVVEKDTLINKYAHYTWIMNRIYNLSCFMRASGKVFNGFSLNNIYLSPDYHTVLLYNGWQFCTDEHSKMTGATREIYNIMSIKCKDSKESEVFTDLESIKLIGRKLFVGCSHDCALAFFNKECDNEPVKDWNEWEKVQKEMFGDRHFIEWDGPEVKDFTEKSFK